MVKKNNAAYMTSVGHISFIELPMPKPSKDEVLLRVEYVGVCGSDVHFFQSGKRKGQDFKLPFLLGHECSGTIVEVGAGVTNFQIDEQVTFEPQITCGKCKYCREGRYNLCPDVKFPSVPPYDGMLRNYVVLPASVIKKLPSTVNLIEGAMIEPLAVGLSAARKGNVTLGSTVIILGAGCIGLMTLLACRAYGASKIIVVDLFPVRLEKAKELGADIVVQNITTADIVQELLSETDNEGADIVFETAGNKNTAQLTPALIKRGGCIVLVGNINDEVPMKFMDLMYKEGEIRTIYRYTNNFEQTINAVATHKIDLSPIHPRIYSFSETQKAFDEAITDKMNIIKSIVKVNNEE